MDKMLLIRIDKPRTEMQTFHGVGIFPETLEAIAHAKHHDAHSCYALIDGETRQRFQLVPTYDGFFYLINSGFAPELDSAEAIAMADLHLRNASAR